MPSFLTLPLASGEHAARRPTRPGRLTIMAKVIVEVHSCDRCDREPAHTWIITGPEGSPRQIDLCDQHSAPIANAYALALPAAPARSSTNRRRRAPAKPAAKPTSPLPPAPPEPVWR